MKRDRHKDTTDWKGAWFPINHLPFPAWTWRKIPLLSLLSRRRQLQGDSYLLLLLLLRDKLGSFQDPEMDPLVQRVCQRVALHFFF